MVVVQDKDVQPESAKRIAVAVEAKKPAVGSPRVKPASASPLAEPEKVRFGRDIRPILSENCFACHGPDPGSRKADMRLDTREGFFADRGDGPMILAGKPLESPLCGRVSSKDKDEMMPPPASHKTLKPAQISSRLMVTEIHANL